MTRRPVIDTREARHDLDRIDDTIAAAADPVTASRYEQRLRAFCNRLDYASERGHRHDSIRPGLRIIGFERRVTLPFIVEPERVVILRLFYGGHA